MSAIEPASETEVYAAVGRALSRWEMLEVNLADLYAFLKGRPGDAKLAQTICDEGRIFAARLAIIEQAAAQYFITNCDQKLEGEISSILKRSGDLALNRNRIAHGLVQFAQFVEVVKNSKRVPIAGYFLIPPWYAMRRLKLDQNSASDAKEIDEMSHSFLDLAKEVQDFRVLHKEKPLRLQSDTGFSPGLGQ